jgi:uncharacterized protein YdcH (DUF465 family)
MRDVRDEIARLREEAARMRQLAQEHGEADHPLVAAKLREFAAELEAKADELEQMKQA